ncbi:unnamed protein product [Ectocarpus sp. CCAP 1310/34]|nr:unnamed protein product [Ectocarpus sp. CCAP 1310/34]
MKRLKDIRRVKNGFISDWMPSGYRDVKVNPVVNDHLCEIQLHLQRFYNLKSGQHAVYEWARELKVTKEMTASHIFENLSPETVEEMVRLARSNWYGTGSCLTDLLSAAGHFVLAEEALRKVTRSA